MSSSTESTISASATATTNPRDRTPYSSDQLKDALDSLLHVKDSESDDDDDAAHIFGHGDPNHRLSMLQVITATRILDYQQQQTSDDTEAGRSSVDDSVAGRPQKRRDRSDILNLQDVIRKQAPVMALAAEFKRASPSKGQIATSEITNNAAEQAIRYAIAGACIVSVLTEPRWFQGSLTDLEQVRAATNKNALQQLRPAILRKDFCISTQMIDEAVDAGADTILLIVAVLPRGLLRTLIAYCRSSAGMEPLVEVHTDPELHVAVSCGAKVIGVNNRNLHTFHLDMNTSTRIAATLDRIIIESSQSSPPQLSRNDFTLCALSGMSTADDVDLYRQAGIEMCLIGESLMRAAHPSQLIADLCLDPEDYRTKKGRNRQSVENGVSAATNGPPSTRASTTPYVDGLQLVKVCGITGVEDALVACRAGANLIGIIFAERSPRKVAGPQLAAEIVRAVRRFGERDDRLDFGTWNGYSHEASVSSTLNVLASKAKSLVSATRRTPGVVGVFQNQDLAWIRSVVDECGLDLVQLHGQEGMEAANASNFGGVPALRVVDIPVEDSERNSNGNSSSVDDDHSSTGVETKILQAVTSDPHAILLDTSIKGRGAGGGTGKAFDWTVASRLQEAGLPVIVAGGLSPVSVSDCCARIRPLGVDVSSGVELQPGVKDHDKVTQFVHAARQAA